jgi:hypothetical protein
MFVTGSWNVQHMCVLLALVAPVFHFTDIKKNCVLHRP